MTNAPSLPFVAVSINSLWFGESPESGAGVPFSSATTSIVSAAASQVVRGKSQYKGALRRGSAYQFRLSL